MPTTAKIESTITVLKGKLTDAAAKKGAEAVGKWEADLEHAEWRGAKTIHADLGRLRHHLENGGSDGASIGDLLVKLGESTERAAPHAEGAQRGKLEELGRALASAGEGLGGKRAA